MKKPFLIDEEEARMLHNGLQWHDSEAALVPDYRIKLQKLADRLRDEMITKTPEENG